MFTYLASPYSHTNPEIREERFRLAEQALAHLLDRSVWTYSPIVHCHALSLRFDLPVSFDFWQEYNFAMLERAIELMVLTLPGWEVSRGVNEEIEFATDKGIPVTYRSLQSLGVLLAVD